MKILYFFENKNIPMDMWQEVHIFDELTRYNCEIIVFNPLKYETLDEANEKLVEEVKKNPYDLFMTCHGQADIYPETVKLIKAQGIPTLLICFDNLLVPFMHEHTAYLFDLVWLTAKETKYIFDKWKAASIFLPYAANPFFFKERYEREIQRVSFMGNPYGSRVNHINFLLDNQIPVTLFSSSLFSGLSNGLKSGSSSGSLKRSTNQPNQPNTKMKYSFESIHNLARFKTGRKVIAGALKQKMLHSTPIDNESQNLEILPSPNFDKVSEVFSNYALSLSTTEARNTGSLRHPVKVVNLRSFEIPMCGGLQFCSYSQELSEYFEEDKEILFYKSNDEFLDKAAFYLKPENESLRLHMKKAARRRAEHDHTWFCRFKIIFDQLELKWS